MRDEWFPHIAFPISWEQFHQLPKSPIYKWEYWDGKAHLSARPKPYHCVLDLRPGNAPDTVQAFGSDSFRFRLLSGDDWLRLPSVFSAAFSHIPPLCGMNEEQALAASQECLRKTQTGGEGPPIDSACWVVTDDEDQPCGAALVTLRKDSDFFRLEAQWRDPALDGSQVPAALPHLTWIFVPPLLARHGLGSAMLAHSVNALLVLGHQQLFSTFWLGNESSTLWHWSNGFRLLSWVASPRAISRRDAELQATPSSAESLNTELSTRTVRQNLE